jgi:hypothetical protein
MLRRLKRHEIEVSLKGWIREDRGGGFGGSFPALHQRDRGGGSRVHVDDAAGAGQAADRQTEPRREFPKLVVEILQEKADLPPVEFSRE